MAKKPARKPSTGHNPAGSRPTASPEPRVDAESTASRTTIGRIPILHVTPGVINDRWTPKAYEGEAVTFGATSFREGHDAIGVELLLRDPHGRESRHTMRLVDAGIDRYETVALLDTLGEWTYRVRAFSDDFATWHHNATVKIDAGDDVELMFLSGAQLLEQAGIDGDRPAPERRYLTRIAAQLVSEKLPLTARRLLLDDEKLHDYIRARPIRSLETLSETGSLRVERRRAGYGAWYEFFPRSEGAVKRPDGSWQSGTFTTARAALERAARMGFDVAYLPPIHPIGTSFRKGPNNTLTAGPHDPGSPWAIGGPGGGHDSVHPDLGTEEEFRQFVAHARGLGLEIALDLALQASPDHPWVTEHPEWFTTRPDGSIAYAENPPKKYQDIYPLNFDNDPDGLGREVLRIVRHWMSLGVTIFRVDNPHTKPVAFWEWLIAEVNSERPDIVFLAEAFTRPAMLTTLAKVGFQQSYTYFTWRNTKAELEEFFESISTETADYLRPNLFVNTPDILTAYLQFGGPAAFTIRAALAATASPVWGVYAGYELFENVARPGSEENIDNEKYEYKPRNFELAEREGRSLALFIGILNQIRREHPALQQLRNLALHRTDDDAIVAFSKHLDASLSPTGTADTIIVVANVDPHSVRETTVHVDVTAFGFPEGTPFSVTDLITGDTWEWGASNYVRLDAFTHPVHIFAVSEVAP